MEKQITSKTDGVTKDMTPQSEKRKELFNFPQLGISVEASSYQEALTKAKKQIKK